MASFYFGKFKPHLVANTQLYYQRKDSTVSLCPDYSPNGFNLTQGVALQQPTLGVNSINFDGSNDVMSRNETSPFIADTQGIMFFSVNNILNTAQRFINISLSNSANLGRNRFSVEITNANQVVAFIRNTGAENLIRTNNTFGAGHIYGYIKSNGSTYEFKVNGVVQTFTMVNGVDDGKWFNFVGATNRISIGGLFSGSTVLYTPDQINKIYYNNGTLSALDLWKIERFMSNPLNYI